MALLSTLYWVIVLAPLEARAAAAEVVQAAGSAGSQVLPIVLDGGLVPGTLPSPLAGAADVIVAILPRTEPPSAEPAALLALASARPSSLGKARHGKNRPGVPLGPGDHCGKPRIHLDFLRDVGDGHHRPGRLHAAGPASVTVRPVPGPSHPQHILEPIAWPDPGAP